MPYVIQKKMTAVSSFYTERGEHNWTDSKENAAKFDSRKDAEDKISAAQLTGVMVVRL